MGERNFERNLQNLEPIFFPQKNGAYRNAGILAAEITWCIGDLTCTYMHDVQTNSYAACVEYLSTHKDIKEDATVGK